MVESVMLVAAGFLAASLLALMLAPVQWRRAVRLTELRIRSKTPLSMAEIQADKDRLRAEFALELRRLEKALEKLKDEDASKRAEIARTTELAKLRAAEALTAAQKAAELEAENDELRQKVIHAESEVKGHFNALKKAQSRFLQQSRELEAARAAAREASIKIDEQKVQIAALQTQIVSGEERLRSLDRPKKRPAADSAEHALTEMAAKRPASPLQEGEVAKLKMEQDRTKGELSLARAELSAQKLEIEALRQEKAARERAAEKMKVRLESYEHMTAADGTDIGGKLKLIEEARDAAASASEQVETDRQRLTGEVEALRRDLAHSRERDRLDNEPLRERLADIAAKVAHMSLALEGSSDPVIEQMLGKSTPVNRDAPANAEPASGNGGHVGNGGNGANGRNGKDRENADSSDHATTAAAPLPTTLADRIRALQAHISTQA